MDIIANLGVIRKYQSIISEVYYQIQNLSDSLYRDIQKWQNEVAAAVSEVSSKINALNNLNELASSKEREFSKMASMYHEEAKRIYDAGYWVERRDENGRVIGRTYVYDYAAYENAQRIAQIYEEKAQKAREIITKIEAYA